MSELNADKQFIKRFERIMLAAVVSLISIFCTACDTVDAINPVVQAGKMQQNANKVTQYVTQKKEYAVGMQKKELEQIENN